MKIGYARVSTTEQNLDMQIKALLEEGCEKIYQEKKSALKERQELNEMLSFVRPGDTIVVWKLDRITRSLKDLVFFIEKLSKRDIDFKSLSDQGLDTTSSGGKLHYQLIAAFAEYERNIIVERTKAGLEAAKEKGVKLGRKPGLSEKAKEKAELAALLYTTQGERKKTTRKIAEILDISTATLYRYLRLQGVVLNKGRSRKKS